MERELVPPLYLTKEVATQAVKLVLQSVFGSPARSLLGGEHLYIVVLVPSVERTASEQDRGFPNGDEVFPYPLLEYYYGDKKSWEHPYDLIARNKAAQLWAGRNDGQGVIAPHLLLDGDTPYWGGVKREGIVVACSGVHPWFDRMIAGIVADVMIAFARNAFEREAYRRASASAP